MKGNDMVRWSRVRGPMATAALVLVVATPRASGSPVSRPDQASTVEKPRARAERVTARELDPTLPAVAIGEWLRTTVGTSDEFAWVQTACPATHEKPGPNPSEWPVCVLVDVPLPPDSIPRGVIPAGSRYRVALSIRLGHGNPSRGAWQTEPPRIEDAFIERDHDSVTVGRLRDLPGLLKLAPAQWPKSDLSVSAQDVHCDNARPKPGETVRCQAAIQNTGPVEAFAWIRPSVSSRGSDAALGKELPIRRFAPNERVVVSWDWVWPRGTAWLVGVWVESHTPGNRIPIQERNVQNNRAYVRFGDW